MKLIIGLIVLFSSVLGGYVLSHGQLLAIWQPYELLIICGAALGALIIAYPLPVLQECGRQIWYLIRGCPYNKIYYITLFDFLIKCGAQIKKKGLMSIEDDIDDPERSPLFQPFPGILQDKIILNFIVDNLRTIMDGNLSIYEFEGSMEQELEIIEHELKKPSQAIESLAEAMPGFGIVAAVLGIVITMQLLGGDPKLLGKHVAAALVGTFLGVFFAYGVLGPIATAIHHNTLKKQQALQCIKVYLSFLAIGAQPRVAIEYARRNMHSDVKISFLELDAYVKG